MSSVTWMIPVLNGMPYLPMTLASIANQTFQDFQAVVWDNGSTDGTVAEARRWVGEKFPGKVVTDRPLALGHSRETMVVECETEFCALIDADDINLPDRLEKQMHFMRKHPEIAVLGSQINQLNSAGEDLGLFSNYPLEHQQIVEQMLVSNPIAQPAVIFRKSAVMSVGNFRDVKIEDYDLWLRIAAAGFRLANLPESLVQYRVHPTSTTQKQLAANILDGLALQHLLTSSRQLFGCEPEVMRELRARKNPHAIDPLRQIAAKLGTNGSDPWKSPVFYNAARSMIADRDVRSRVVAAMENKGISGAIHESGRIGISAVREVIRKLKSTRE